MKNAGLKYIRVLKELIKIRFHGLMVFRMDFFAPFFVDGSLFVIQLLAFGAIYTNVEKIGNWGQGEMIVYIGTFSLINAVSMFVCFFGVNSIPWKVRNGELDLYLTKPVSPLFRLSLENINPGSLPLVLMSICILIYGMNRLAAPVRGTALASYCFWVFIMIILYYDMEVLIRSVSLYVVSTARMEELEDAGISLCMKLPGIAFYGIYKAVFYLFLPYGLMATLPVQSMMGEMTPRMGLYGVSVVIGFTVLLAVVWKHGLKRYNSVSS